MKLTPELIDQLAPDPGPEPIDRRFHALDRWTAAKKKRDQLIKIYETERLHNIITGRERPFPCKILEPIVGHANKV
jgi:hypothetical protein